MVEAVGSHGEPAASSWRELGPSAFNCYAAPRGLRPPATSPAEAAARLGAAAENMSRDDSQRHAGKLEEELAAARLELLALSDWRSEVHGAEQRQAHLASELQELGPVCERISHVEELARAAVDRSMEVASTYSALWEHQNEPGALLHEDADRLRR
eukprot:NODE_27011_length_529_cov_2.400498.p1 GENE.NODE_27011_length_529_cov_2.400498~~NODE_27011_length_529_cov_2.400498.p1  ORF type:complete len:156 (+),score=42.56 NODE_27011_length_529_cov_2.400498:3-470(+)